MTQADWTAPPKSEPPDGDGRTWRVAEDDRGVVIASVVPGVNVPAKLVATVESREDADLIVYLREKHRKGLL